MNRLGTTFVFLGLIAILGVLLHACESPNESGNGTNSTASTRPEDLSSAGTPNHGGAPRELRPTLRLGMDSENTEQLLYRPKGVVIDASGRVFVLDNDNGRIAVYSASGEFLRGIGRSGPGPGEFEGSPNVLDGLALDADLVVAFEGPTRRIQIFTTDGTYVSSFAKRLGLSSIAIAGERIYTSTAGQSGADARVEVFSLSGDLVTEFGEGGVGEASTAREARRLNRSFIAVAPGSGDVGRVYQYTPILRIYRRDGSLRAEADIELSDSFQPPTNPPGVSLSERTVRPLVARDIEYVSARDLWVVLLAEGVIRAYANDDLEIAGEFRLLKPEDHNDPEDSIVAASLDIGISPAGDLVCTTVAVEHEVWCYELQWNE